MSHVLTEMLADENRAQALHTRRAERGALLGRITEMLEEDSRIAAAWLFGSARRGEAGDLSDLDLRVIVYDEHIGELYGERQAYAAQVGEAVLFQEAPQNRPAGGAFLLALYEGQFGTQEVDWTWQPLSSACLWSGTRILFNRADLTPGEMPWGYQLIPPCSPLEKAVRRVNNFWGMLLVIAKYATRSPWEASIGLIGMSVQPLREVSEYFGVMPIYTMDSLPPHGQPLEKLRLLHVLAEQMTKLMPRVEAQGASVPWVVVPQAHRFLDLIEAVMTDVAAPVPA